VFNIFKKFQDLVACNHNTVHLKWRATSFDLNMPEVEYLCFEPLGYTFWATCLNVNGKKVQVAQKIFGNLVENAKASCSSL